MNEQIYSIWAGRFQPLHLGHIRTLHRIASLGNPTVVAVIAPSDSMTKIGGGYSAQAAAANARGRNLLTVWERRQMFRLALADEDINIDIDVIGIPRPDIDWKVTSSFYPPFRTICVTDRDEFEELKAKRYRRLGENVSVIGVRDLPPISGTEFKQLLRSGGNWQYLLHPATRSFFLDIDGPRRFSEASGAE